MAEAVRERLLPFLLIFARCGLAVGVWKMRKFGARDFHTPHFDWLNPPNVRNGGGVSIEISAVEKVYDRKESAAATKAAAATPDSDTDSDDDDDVDGDGDGDGDGGESDNDDGD